MAEQDDSQVVGTSRRALLKGAVGSGIAVAVYAAPKVSVIPAYGLTTSNGFDGKCYGFGWESNDPDGKGWAKLSDQSKLHGDDLNLGGGLKTGNNVKGPNDGPSSHQGDGAATYTWEPNGAGVPPTRELTVSGCVNKDTGATFTVTELDAGWCLDLLNSGNAIVKNQDKCGIGTTAPNDQTWTSATDSWGVTQGVQPGRMAFDDPADTGEGATGTITGLGNSVCRGNKSNHSAYKVGKFGWTFDIIAC